MEISILDLTTTASNAIIVTAILSIFFIFAGIKISKADPSKPSRGLVLVMEFIYTFLIGFAKGQVGETAVKYVPFIMTVGAYLALANLVGLLGLIPPTSNININVALAVTTLLYLMISGIRAKGIGKYLKDVYVGAASAAPPVIKQLIILINIIGEIGKIISLSLRLFGNIASGALLLALVSELVAFMLGLFPSNVGIFTAIGSLFGGALNVSVLPFLNAYFDIFAGLMQTMIFCILMMMWLNTAVAKEQ